MTGLEREFSSTHFGHRPIDISRKVQDFGQRQQHQPFVKVYLTLTEHILRSVTGLKRGLWTTTLSVSHSLYDFDETYLTVCDRSGTRI